MKEDGRFERLLKMLTVQNRFISVIFDEGHCIDAWGVFRPEYREVERLRYRLKKDIPFALVSATLPPAVRDNISKILHLNPDRTTSISRSTDWPNILLAVRKMQFPASSYKDLDCVIPRDGRPPKKFVIFFDSIAKLTEGTKHLWDLIGSENAPHEKVVWFHSQMSDKFKREQLERLRRGELWGICTTDSFGMVIFNTL